MTAPRILAEFPIVDGRTPATDLGRKVVAEEHPDGTYAVTDDGRIFPAATAAGAVHLALELAGWLESVLAAEAHR